MKRFEKFHAAMRGLTLTLAALLVSVATFAQKVTVSGQVTTAADKQPLVGVSVIPSSGGGTITDAQGNYSIDVAANETLTFSYLGYEEVSQKVAGRTTINVALKTDAKSIDEVVVLGYTSQKKNELSSSIVTIDSEALTDVTSADIGNMLQGKAAGVLVMNASGQPGASADIRIRGTGSISAGAGPLYVVDGVAGGSFNPNDVETLTILKDASATALYGASASGGVIVITTKSAKSDKATVNFKANVGVKKALSGRFSPMGSEELYYTQKAMMSKTMFKTIRPSSLLNTDFDWMNAAFKIGVVQDYYASAAGRSGKTNYFVSLDHYDEEGSLINTNFERTSARVNLSTAINDKLTMNVRLNYSKSNDQSESSYVTLECAYRTLPWDSPYDVNTGEVLYIDSDKRSDNGEKWYSHDKYNLFHNELYNYSRSKSESLVADLQLIYNITDWLMFTSTNRFDSSNWFSEQYIDPRTASTSYTNGYIYNGTGAWSGIGSTNILKAQHEIGDHSFSGIIGFEYGEGNSRDMWASGTDMPAGQAALSSATYLEQGGYNYMTRSWSALAQAQYSYAGKYVATASVRYDETSKFAPKARGGVFPGISAAWIASEEEFLQYSDVVNMLKVRAGYGKTGNSNIANFLYQDSYVLSAQYENKVAAVLERQSNPNLGWEEAYMASFGVDARLYDRIDVTVDLYDMKNANLLLAVPTSPSSGFISFMDNVGVIRNRGIEFMANATILSNHDWTWDFGLNLGINKNKVEKLPNGDFLQSTSTGVKQLISEGKNMNTWYMPIWAGVDPDNGDPLWETGELDESGNPITTSVYEEAAYQEAGLAVPLFSGGLSSMVRYKDFTLSINGGFVVGNKIYNEIRTSMDSDGSTNDYNMVSFYNGLGWSRWEEKGDVATHPKIQSGGNKKAHSYSSRYLEDGSFFRLRNVTLSYNLPKAVAARYSMQGARIFISADNILTLTRFSGMDPEVRLENTEFALAGTYSTNYPVPMSITAGIDVTF